MGATRIAVRAVTVTLLVVLAGSPAGGAAGPVPVPPGGGGRIERGGGGHKVAVTPDGRAWVTDEAAPRVWVVEPSTGSVATLPIRGTRPHGIAATPDRAPRPTPPAG